MGSKHLTVQFVRSYLEENGCKFVSLQGYPSTGVLTYIAQCGHQNICTFKDFKRGLYRKCRKCKNSTKGDFRIVCVEELKKRFVSFGCKILDFPNGYKNQRSLVRYIGKCGHVMVKPIRSVLGKKNRICRCCEEKKHHEYGRLSYDDVKRTFEENGCVLLSTEYVGSMKKLHYIAQCGHENYIALNTFKNGSGRKCNVCAWNHQSQQVVFDTVVRILNWVNDIRNEYGIVSEIGHQRIDIAIPSLKIAIEYNGFQHYQDETWYDKRKHRGYEYQKAHDDAKLKWCKENGYVLIEIDGRDWPLKKLLKEKFVEVLRDLIIPISNLKYFGLHTSDRYKLQSPKDVLDFRSSNVGKNVEVI